MAHYNFSECLSVTARDSMASVFLGDLNDFIAPGQACINPLFTTPTSTDAAAPEKTDDSKAGRAPVQLVLEDDGGPLDAMEVSA